MTPRRPRQRLERVLALVLALGCVGPASSQILGGSPLGGAPLGSGPIGGLPLPSGLPDRGLPGQGLARPLLDDARGLLDQRVERLQSLVRDHRDLLETDEHGDPVMRGEVIALSPGPETLAKAQAAGFRILSRSQIEELGLEVVVLAAPRGQPARSALKRLRGIDPQGRFELDHVYETSGGVGAGIPAATGETAGPAVRVGMIDTGVAARHPALSREAITQEVFAPGAVTPRAHGTAVASLLAGSAPPFRGAAPGSRVYVADVFGSGPVGGASVSIARALGWMAKNRVAVVNVSLVGPDDLTLKTVVEAMTARGFLIVAAAGNDGPAAPPAYPASYPGVIAVTAVDAHGRVLPEAGRPSHIDFAAPGSDMAAAGLEGWTSVRGTSFASPLVAGRLALGLTSPQAGSAVRVREALARAGRSLTVGGRFHAVLVADDLRVAPGALGIRDSGGAR